MIAKEKKGNVCVLIPYKKQMSDKKNIKLICIPYAGGSATSYNKYKAYLNDNIDLYTVELSGRGRRYNEPFYETLDEAVYDILLQIEKEILCSDYIFLGHSMGSVLALELTHRLMDLGYKEPKHIIFSGRVPPNKITIKKKIYDAPFPVLKEEILRLGGTPLEFFQSQELMDIYLPIMRADYKILETYSLHEFVNKLSCSISVFLGDKDLDTSIEDMKHWKLYTNNKCTLYMFHGGHFFINDCVEDVVSVINEIVNQLYYM